MHDVVRVQSNNNTVIDGRSWRAGQVVDVPETEVDALRPHIAAGVLTVVGDATPMVGLTSYDPPPPAVPDFLAADDDDTPSSATAAEPQPTTPVSPRPTGSRPAAGSGGLQ